MLRFFAILGAALILTSTAAEAFSRRQCYDTPLRFRGTVGTLGMWSGSFPAGSWRDGAFDGMAKFNTHPANYRLDLSVDSFHVSPGNGESEMWFTVDDLWLSNAPAIAHYYDICIWFFGITDGYYVNEVDVLFDANTNYSTSEEKRDLTNYGGPSRPFKTTMLHEVGHGTGFAHNNRNYNIMGSDPSHIHVNGAVARAYVGEDFSAGMLASYGPKAETWEDLSVSHWRYFGVNGEYSMHRKVEVIGVGGEKPTRDIDGEAHYDVTAGELIFFRFTYENTGRSCQNANIGFYLSGNATISNADRRIGERTTRVCPNAPDTRTHVIRLPSDIRPGALWLGAIVNDFSPAIDRERRNDATYIPLFVN